MRIAVLNRIFAPTGGGAERYSIALVEQLAARHEIHVFAQQIAHQMPGVHYHRVPQFLQRPRWVNQLWFALASWWLTRRGFDVVHAHENTWHGQIQTVHVVPIRCSLLKDRTGWAMALRWLKIATSPRLLVYLALESARYRVQGGRRLIVLAASSLESAMTHSYPHAVPACRVVTPGVAAVPGLAQADTRAQARAQLGLPAQGRCVLFVGNDFRKKGLPTLLQALPELPIDVYMAVVGNAAQRVFVQDALAALPPPARARVHFLGALGSVDVAYQAADCLAHPTLEDTFAMVVLEAQAHGLPVVVSSARTCGIAALLQDGREALVLDNPRDASALALALNRVLQEPALAEHLRTHGLEFARRHQWSAIARLQEALYFEVARNAAPQR